MSRFFSEKYIDLEPYVPGEQPRDQQYVKLNTNENPYPPLPEVTKAVEEASRKLYLYSDTECVDLRKALATLSCSAWLSRSAASQAGLDLPSAATRISLGPAIISMETMP